jgi:hypothetical protein
MSIRDVSIAQKRSLVTIEPMANCHHAGEHVSGNATNQDLTASVEKIRRGLLDSSWDR